MAPEEPEASAEGNEAADMAKAFQELAKGERTATMLENQLNKMEARIAALLEQAEKEQEQVSQIEAEKSESSASQSKDTQDQQGRDASSG